MADQPKPHAFADEIIVALKSVERRKSFTCDADAVLALPEMQQVRQLIAALHRASHAAFVENDDAALERINGAMWDAFDGLSGCVREWATTPEPKKEA